MENTDKAVQKVTIRSTAVLYKNGEPANAIELVQFNFSDGEECGFTIVSRKGLYEVGDNAYYFQPDYCLSENALFADFIEPEGNPSKSRLGKQNRIRAIKFNFSLSEFTNDPIYSVGILMPENEVLAYLRSQEKHEGSLSERLGVFKYEEPEKSGSGMAAGDFPSFMYKTDEDNCIHEDVLIDTEQGYISIKELCESDNNIKVKSYNRDFDCVEYKEVISKDIHENNNDWFEITTESGIKLILTSNHLVFLPEFNCYRTVENLIVGDLVFKTE